MSLGFDPKKWIDANGEVGVIKNSNGVVVGYKGTPWGDITVVESDNDWHRKYWASIMDPFILADDAFTPTFLEGRVIYDADGQTVSQPLQGIQFATRETAQWIANKYGNGKIVEVPYMDAPVGLVFDPPNVWNFIAKDGRSINAGSVAVYYANNPRRTAELQIRAAYGF